MCGEKRGLAKRGGGGWRIGIEFGCIIFGVMCEIVFVLGWIGD